MIEIIEGSRRFDRRAAYRVSWSLFAVALALPWGTGALVKI